MCGAPTQTLELPPGISLERETVLRGRVLTGPGRSTVGGAFVRLLDGSGEFTAEVVSSATGDFQFFAGPGTWTVRALHRSGNGSAVVEPDGPGLYPVDIVLD